MKFTSARIIESKTVEVEPWYPGQWIHKRLPHKQIVIDKGPNDGVFNGWHGYLDDGYGKPVPWSEFILKHESSTRSGGFIDLSTVNIRRLFLNPAHAPKRVLLSKEGIHRPRSIQKARLTWIQQRSDGSFWARVNRGTWSGVRDTSWKVRGRRGRGYDDFEIVRVYQHETLFVFDGGGRDQLRTYSGWELVPEKRRRRR